MAKIYKNNNGVFEEVTKLYQNQNGSFVEVTPTGGSSSGAYSNIVSPVITSPVADSSALYGASLSVTVDSFTVVSGLDTQKSLTALLCSSNDISTVVKTKTATGTGLTVTFTADDLSSLTVNQNYYLFAYQTGVNNGDGPVSKSIKINFINNLGTLESASWDDISRIGQAGVGDMYWDIGDTKSVTLSGTVGTLSVSGTYKVTIIDFNYRGDNGIYFQGFKDSNGVDIALCDGSYNSYKTDGTKLFNMNHWGNANHGGWKGCDLRYDILGSTDKQPSGYGAAVAAGRTGYDATATAKTGGASNTLMRALPTALRNVLQPWTVYADGTGNSSNVEGNVISSVDYLPLLSEYEVQGAHSYANQYEQNYQAQMAYYANGNSKVKYKHNASTSVVFWWCRSASCSSSLYFCFVSSGGGANDYSASASFGLAPAFRI